MRGEFFEVLIGLILGIISERFVRPWLQGLLTRIEVQRARSRYGITRIPDPPTGFNSFRIGNIEVAVMNLVGSPESPFDMSEVKVEFEPIMRHQQADYPTYLVDAQPYLEQEYLRRLGLDEFPGGYRNLIIRLSDFRQDGETVQDKRGGITLHLGLTTFDTYLLTNRSLDYNVIPDFRAAHRFTRNQTIRQAYVKFPYDLGRAILANPIAVIVVVISRNLNQHPKDQVIIRYRSHKVASYRNRFQVSAAGYLSTSHRDQRNMPSLFVTAVDEARQEIADSLVLEPSEFKLIGLALSWEDMLPCAYGFIETGKSVRTLLGDFRRDTYEGDLSAIPFDPAHVLSHIAHNKWTPESVLAMCATLLAHFPRHEVEAEARAVPASFARDFYEDA